MRRKLVTLLVFIFVAVFQVILEAQESINAEFESKDNKIVITYDLKGEADTDYNVQVVLKKQSDPGFIMHPDNLEGDYGDGEFAGNSRKIYWEPDEDEVKQLYGDDYYFELKAEETQSGASWYIILAGVMIAGSATAIVLAIK